MPDSATQIRPIHTLPMLALLGALGVAGFYNGPAFEIPLLLWSSLALSLGVAVASASGRVPDSVTARTLACGCSLYLLWLLVAWRLSVSPAVSLAPLWALAATPMAMLLVLLSPLPAARILMLVSAVALTLVVLGVVDLLPDGTGGDVALHDENTLATLANVPWPPLLMLALARSRAGSLSWPLALGMSLALAACVALLALSSSRAGVFIAAALAAPLLLLVAQQRAWRLLVAVGVGVLLGALVSIAPGYGTDGGVGAVAQVQAYGGGIFVREVLIRAALDIWQTAPWTGTGPQTFHLLYGAARSPDDHFSSGYFVLNDFVQFLQGGGPLQLGALLGLTLWLLRMWWLSAWRLLTGTAADADLLRLGCASGAGAILGHALFNMALYILPLALLLGVLAGCAARASSAPQIPQAATTPVWPRRLAMGSVGCFVLLALPVLTIDALAAAVFMGQPGFPGSSYWRESGVRQQQLARTLLPVTPDDSLQPLMLAMMARDVAQLANNDATQRDGRALSAYYFEQALARDATNIDAWRQYAQLAHLAGGRIAFTGLPPRTELDLLREAYRLRPHDVETAMILSRRLQDAGATAERERVLVDGWLPHCRYTARINHVLSTRLLAQAEQLRAAGAAVPDGRLRSCTDAVRLARQRLGLPELAAD